MDETGFVIGQGGSERVLVPVGDQSARFKAQPDSRESVTVIECIGSGGQVLPPLIITRGKVHTVGEFRRMENVPASWHFAKATKAFTSQKQGLDWLENIFDVNTQPPTPSQWRLLLIDGQNSHTSLEFIVAAWNRRIVPFLLVPHSTHVMQPLDVVVFAPLKGAYRHLINDAARYLNAMHKSAFATIYAQARKEALTASLARKAFTGVGVSTTPDPTKMLNRLAKYSGQQSSAAPQQEQHTSLTRGNVSSMIDEAFTYDPDFREARGLKRTLVQEFDESRAKIAALEAKNKLFREREAQDRQKAKISTSKAAAGDFIALSKDRRITREYAERELVALEPKIANSRIKALEKMQRQEEKRRALPSALATDDGDEVSQDGDKGGSALLSAASTPGTQLIDNINDGSDPVAISNDDDDMFGFFNTVPAPSSSRRQL